MFLPVLLVRDYGVWGWIVFAVPNVIGAAAMGWTVKSQDDSRRLVEAHGIACVCFSVITVAFHVFFSVWISELFTILWIAALAAAAICWIAGRGGRRDRAVAVGVLTLSLSCFAWKLQDRQMLSSFHFSSFYNDVLPLSAVSVFGFALCPYLDLTFHRARQATGETDARLAFGAGFGCFFALMILFSLLYAFDIWIKRFLPRLSYEPTRNLTLLSAVAVHMFCQIGFTTAVHTRAVTRGITPRKWVLLGSLILIAIGLGWCTHHFPRAHFRYLNLGEAIYRLFMSFYGLLFPAYVWLCMLPTWNSPQRPTRRQWGVFAVAVVLAAPAFWVAFIEGRMMWVLPGLAGVLLARLLIPTRPAGEVAA
jgi:hypothetical protein